VPPAQLGHRPPLLQATLDQRRQGDVVERGHDQVGACRQQQVPVVQAGHPDRRHAAGLGRLHPAVSVLDHEGVGRAAAELLGGGEEDGRVRLAPGEIPARDVGVEQVLQGHAGADELVVEPLLGGKGVEADPLQEQLGVLGRGRRRDQDPGRLDGQDEPQRVGEGHEPAFLDEPDDLLLLHGGVPLGPGLHIGDAEVLEGRAGAGQTRLARHEPLVHRRGEVLGRPAGLVADLAPLPLQQTPQRLAPGQLMGRVDQHAVHVEDRTLERHVPHPALSQLPSGLVILRPRLVWPR
jgi:hypothetical protein